MENINKEGAGRPLYSSAPKNLPAVPHPLPGSRILWGAAALVSYPLAWYYTKYVFMGNSRSIGYLVFPVLFMAAVELFSRALGRKGSRETWFWGACWLAQGLAINLYASHTDVLRTWQPMVWHMTAVYFVLCRTGMQAAGKANAMVVLDGLTGVFVLPWTGLFLRLRALWELLLGWARRRTASRRRIWEALAGVVLALLLVWFAAGQLAAANEAFGNLVDDLLLPLQWNWDMYDTVALVLSIPVGMWLFGLVGGGLRRKTPPLTEAGFYAALGRAPRLPDLTANLAVGALCAVYALFFAVQCGEFAAALGAPVPLEAVEASQFAVGGFWELCRVLVLDFAVLGALHFLSPAPVDRPGRRRGLLTLFCAFGLGFVGLAAAKLGVYIRLWGLTPRRITSAWCLAVLGLAAVLALLRLWRKIPAVRIWVLAAMVSFCVLCGTNLERISIRDHLDRVQAGTTMDWDLLADCAYGRPKLADELRQELLTMDLTPQQQREMNVYCWIWQ